MFRIADLKGRQILDSRGNPTVEVDVTLDSGATGRAGVPSGASTGSHEAVELRDGAAIWGGKGVSKAVENVNSKIREIVSGREFESISSLDQAMIEGDGTPNKGAFGANAVLGVSLAATRALSQDAGVPVWKWVQAQFGAEAPKLPVPMLNIINGGEHANNSIDVQEFMIVPHGFRSFSEALEAAVRVFHRLRQNIDEKGFSTAVGDEGGFAPQLKGNRQALEFIISAIEDCGFSPGDQISLALDVAATELWNGKAYEFKGDNVTFSASDLVAHYTEWCDDFPLVSIEDGCSEDDIDGWKALTRELGDRIQLVGDDLFVTNVDRLRMGIENAIANSMLVKVNQIGSVSETFSAMKVALDAGFTNVMSHRSGETADSIIADLAVGTACGQIKTGAPSRSDRVEKYNQLIRIEEQLGTDAQYVSPFAAGDAKKKEVVGR